MDFSTFLLYAGIISVGSFIQGLTGFGFAMLSVSLLSLLAPPVEVVAIVAVLAPFQVIWNWRLHRKAVVYRETIPVVIAGLLMLPVGAYGLYHLPESLTMSVLGFTVILLIILHRTFGYFSQQYLATLPAAVGFGALSGIVGGAFAAPGPILVAYLYGSNDSRIKAKANAQFALSIIGIAILGTHIFFSSSVLDIFVVSLIYLPLIFAFTSFGAKTGRSIPNNSFAALTDFLLIIVGIYLIIQYWV